MVRCVLCCLAMLCVTVQFAVSVQAAEPFDLPDCTADFSSEVVLNTSALETMHALLSGTAGVARGSGESTRPFSQP